METLLITVLAICWYVSGICSFIYWWTKEYDFRSDDISTALFVGIIGILAWLVGWFILGSNSNNYKVIIKKREKLL